MSTVVVIGSANVDHTVHVEELPARGATVLGTSYATGPGGKGLNQAVAAARQGAEVRFIGCVGEDGAGAGLIELLAAEGIDVDGVRRLPETPTGTALITVAADGANTIVVAPGANGEVTPNDVRVEGAAVVLVQQEIPADVVAAALMSGRLMGSWTILNPAPARRVAADVLRDCDYVIPNETEVAAMTGIEDPEAAARSLVDQGAACVVVTLGERGALVVDSEGVTAVPALPADVVDTTGAGDAFCGAFAAAIAAGHGRDTALRWATEAGAAAVGTAGAVASLPRR